MNLKRRKFLSLLGIAAVPNIVSSAKPSKKPISLSPTHLIKAQSKKNPKSYAQFPCVLETCKSNLTGDILAIDETITVTYENDKQEEFVITEIEKLEFGAFVEMT